MQVAYYHDKLIHLSSCERKEWQQLYMASMRQDVTCIHCHTPLRMEITIHTTARFFHTQETEECRNVACLMSLKFETAKNGLDEDQSDSKIGMSLPKNIKISDSNTKKLSTWKEPETIKAIPTFYDKSHFDAPSLGGYRLALHNNNIRLDNQQWSAVTNIEGPLLILAGAGSGKTRVLTTRTAYMLAEKNYSPKKMVLFTFTAKAASEMKERMHIYPGINRAIINQLVIGTFHSIFYKMLLHDDPELWHATNLLKLQWQRQAMLKEAGREIDLDEKEFPFDQALTQISWWKNHLLSPEQVKTKDRWEEQTAYLYKRYEQMRLANKMFDFDDMLLGTHQLLNHNHQLLERYQQRFSYISIDEFQDVNKVQVELISMLAAPSNNLCVVGDDDQSIYAFRGSDPAYILSFKEQYKNANIVVLNENYRSNHEIISSAHNVISTNRTRMSKTIQAQLSTNKPPLLFYPYNEEEEAIMIVADIKKQIEQGEKAGTFAILFRTNTAARAVIERFIYSSIPFQLDTDGESFYRRHSIRKILAFLHLAQNPDDASALPDLVGALFLKQEVVREIKALSITNDCSFVEAIPFIQGLQSFQSKKLASLPLKFKKLQGQSPVEAISFIESQMGFNDYIKKQGNEGNKMERGSDDIRDLKVVAQLYTTMTSFLAHIDHVTATYDALHKQAWNKEDAVQLMTIHRAKGLEFKSVYLIGAVEGGLPHEYALDAWRESDDKPLEEERRLMYVAITRAADNLIVSVPMMRRGSNATRSRFIREMQRLGPIQQTRPSIPLKSR